MKYTKIKSEYIRKKLKQAKYRNREYIDTLMKIEGLTQGRRYGMSTGHMFLNLPEMYPEEWKAIWLELNPKRYHEVNERKKKDKEREEFDRLQFSEQRRKETNENKRDWLKAGGKE